MVIRAVSLAFAIASVIPSRSFSIDGSVMRPKWGPFDRSAPSTPTSSLSSTASAQDASKVLKTEKDSNVKTADLLSLDSIRSTLIRQEETIIFAIIERAQFRRNSIVYEEDGFGDLGVPSESTVSEQNKEKLLSFMEFMLVGTEVLHCGVRRYTSPEEHPFFPDRLPAGPLEALPQLKYPTNLLSSKGNAISINFNPILMTKYIEWVLPSITKAGDDEQHGATVLCDIAVLQALSRRVHYGKFVAESKYRSDPEGYKRLVSAGDAEGVMKLLTNAAVEKKVLKRARLKAATYGTEPSVEIIRSAFDSEDMMSGGTASVEGKVDPTVIEDIYKKFIIPLTKDIEVAYLFQRCGRDPPAEYAPDRMSQDIL